MVANLVKANFNEADAVPSGSLTIRSMDDLSRMAKMMADSGFFSDCRQAAQAGVKIMAGLELGFPAFSSLTGIHIIQGKPAIGANLMAAAVKRSGKYNYRVLEHSSEVCRIAFFENGEQVGVSEFTAADAKSMSVKNMDRMAKNMLFARAMSNGVKWYAPDIFLGAPVYTPEELGASVDDAGVVTMHSTVVSSAPEAETQSIAPTEAEPFQPHTRFITPAERKDFYNKGKATGYSDAAMKLMLESYGVFSSKEIPVKKYDAIYRDAGNAEQAALFNEKVRLAAEPQAVEVEAVLAATSEAPF